MIHPTARSVYEPSALLPRLSAQCASGPCSWLDIVARCGPAGSEWAVVFLAERKLRLQLLAVPDMIREQRLAASSALLAECLDAIEQIVTTTVRLIYLERYHRAAAFYHYRIRGWAEAENELCLAEKAIAGAIQCQPFLLPVASNGLDICINRARIAREERDWETMWAWLQNGRALVSDQAPLSHPRQSWEVRFKDIVDLYYASLANSCDVTAPAAPLQEFREDISDLLDPLRRKLAIPQWLAGLCSYPALSSRGPVDFHVQRSP